jgi:pimeloyl-ACP methyl ester carboxylesterase
MPFVTANGTDLYFERAGRGPRLCLVLGSNSTLDGSRLLVDQFVRHFDLVVADHRGMGRSGPVTGPYAMATCAADALAVMDAVGWSTAGVCGISFGGMVAQELAVTAPDRVERLALLCTSAGGAGGASYPLHELAGLGPDARAAAFIPLLDTRFDDRWLSTHPGDRNLVAALAARNTPVTEESEVGGAVRQLEARRGHDVWDRLAAVSCPTLVASGRFDGIAPPGNGRAIASRIDGAELRIYDGGHAFLAQDPAALPEIVAFLSAPLGVRATAGHRGGGPR